jgi:glycosyltransferase involved in cell wall biosynthesis
LKIAFLTTDNREHHRRYDLAEPYFGTAPEALLQGFAEMPELDVHVISCTQGPMKSPEKLADNTWFHSLLVPKIGWLRTGYQGCIRAVRKKLKEIRPDLVHGQGTERDCAISAVFSGFPNVVTIHGNMTQLAMLFNARIGTYSWLAARLENFALRRTAGVFCNSAYTEDIVRLRTKKTWRVPNPLRQAFLTSPQRSARSADCILLCVGVIMPRKRQLELLDVAKDLLKQGQRLQLHFIGAADPSNRYVKDFFKKIASLGLQNHIKYLGELSTEQLINHFDSASGLIHFPIEEAFGLVVAEALARNLKLFASRVGGIADITSGAPDVELFSEDDWRGLTVGISRWMSGNSPRPTSADAIMRQRYSPSVVAQQHTEVYREVLSKLS